LDGFGVIAVNATLWRGLDGLCSLMEEFVNVEIHSKSLVISVQAKQFSEW